MYKPAPLTEIKKELKNKSKEELALLVIELCKLNKLNKELITYQLFHAETDVQGYLEKSKEIVLEAFRKNSWNRYQLAAKSIRKTNKVFNEHLKIMQTPAQQLDLLIFYLKELNSYSIDEISPGVLGTNYIRLVKKLYKIYSQLHEDYQFDYQETVEAFLSPDIDF
ncbi:MAG: hypothetical protein ACXITV_03905 [Luteibaculaceae bacterium]